LLKREGGREEKEKGLKKLRVKGGERREKLKKEAKSGLEV